MEKKTMSTKKKLAILAGIIAAIFIGVNLAWFIGVWMPYNNYAENMTPLNDGTRYCVYTDDKYDYYVKKPFYLSFDKSFFRIEDKGGVVYYLSDVEGEEAVPAKEKYITLFIWPSFGDGNYTYGIFYEGYLSGENYSTRFYIDENVNVISDDKENPENNKKYEQIVSENSEAIADMIHRAKTFWEF